MKIFHDQKQRSLACFLEPQRLDVVERAPPTLDRVESDPHSLVHWYVEQGQQRRNRRFERPGEHQNLACNLLADRADVVPRVDFEIAPEELDHRQVARRLAVRYPGAIEDEPVL